MPEQARAPQSPFRSLSVSDCWSWHPSRKEMGRWTGMPRQDVGVKPAASRMVHSNNQRRTLQRLLPDERGRSDCGVRRGREAAQVIILGAICLSIGFPLYRLRIEKDEDVRYAVAFRHFAGYRERTRLLFGLGGATRYESKDEGREKRALHRRASTVRLSSYGNEAGNPGSRQSRDIPRDGCGDQANPQKSCANM